MYDVSLLNKASPAFGLHKLFFKASLWQAS
jgi:hypothetical protein